MAATDSTEIIRGQMAVSPLIGALPAPQRERLIAAARLERYRRPTLLAAPGQPLSQMWLVVEGYIELTTYAPSGSTISLVHIGRGQWATWLGCFDDNPPQHHIYSSAQASFVSLPCRELRAVADSYPPLYKAVISHIGKRFRLLMEWTELSALLSHEHRMAKLLVVTAGMGEVHGDSATVLTTQEELARQAHCSRQSANQQLAALAERGLIERGYRCINIPSLAALNAFALSAL